MLTNIKKVWDKIKVSRTFPRVALSAAEQTRATWPRLIDSYASAPDIYQACLLDLAKKNKAEFPFTVLVPARGGILNRTPEKLVSAGRDTIYIVVRKKNRNQVKAYPISQIIDVEVGLVLLDAWFQIRGLAANSQIETSKIGYNSVQRALFERFVNQIRALPAGSDLTSLAQEKAKFDYLERANFKFRNYARKSIVGDERVIQSVWQPEFRLPRAGKLSSFFNRKISPAHLLILTDQELILISDVKSQFDDGVRHGGAWQYIPIGHLVDLTITLQEDKLWRLTIELTKNIRIKRLYFNEKECELEKLRENVKKHIETANPT